MKKKYLIVGLIVWLLYAVPATIFVNRPYLTDEINTWEDGELHYKWAISLFPAFVSVFGFEMRHQDRNVQWTANIDRVSTLINPFALFRQEFQTVWVRGTGIDYVFRFRQRKPGPVREALRPLFPGLGPKEKRAPQSGEKKLWKIYIRGIKLTNLRDIWFEEYRFKGKAHVSGKFRIQPKQEVFVGPAYLDIDSGQINMGEKFVGDIGSANFRVELTPFHPDFVDEARMRFVNVEGEMDIEKMHFDVLNLYLLNSPWVHIEKGPGKLHCHLDLRKGSFHEKTSLKAEADETEVHLFGQTLHGKTLAEWKIVPEGKDKILTSHFSVGLEKFSLLEKEGKQYAKGDSLKVTLKSPDLELDKFLNLVAGRLDVEKLDVSDLSFISDYFPAYSDVKVKKGKAALDGFLNFGEKGADDSGQVKIKVSDGALAYKDLLFNVQADVDVNLPKGHVKKRQFETKGTVVNVTSQFLDKAWSGIVKIETGEITLAKPFQFSGKILTQMTDLSPFLAIYAEGKPVPGVLATLLSVKDVKATTDVSTNQKETRFERAELTSDKLKLNANLKYSKDDSQTFVLAQFGPFAVGIEKTAHSNRVILNDAIRWFQKYKLKPKAIP